MPRKPAAQFPAPVPAAAEAVPLLSYAAFTAFGQGAIDAAMETNAAWSAGLEALGQECAGYVRASFESAAETARALLGARTFEDVVRLQTDLAKSQFEHLIERSTKLSELGCSALRKSVASWEPKSAPSPEPERAPPPRPSRNGRRAER